MIEKSPHQLVEEIIELMDNHGFTTEDVTNVDTLKGALNDLIHENQSQHQYLEWWETYHSGNSMKGYDEPF